MPESRAYADLAFDRTLDEVDPFIADLTRREHTRQHEKLILIPSESLTPRPVREALDIIAEATRRLALLDPRGPLTVSAIPSFAAKWLLPRLADFRALHPDIDVRISADDRLVDFARHDVDLAMRMGNGKWPGVEVIKLMGARL